MVQPVSSLTARVTVLLQGHVIDSLTLSKVIDQVQAMGGDYELNDIRIGGLKKDISSVNLTLSADTESRLQDILAELHPYGVSPLEAASPDVSLTAVTADGKLPDAALELKLPSRVKVTGQWLAVLGSPQAMAVVVEPKTRQASLKAVADLRSGDQVVACGQGVLWS